MDSAVKKVKLLQVQAMNEYKKGRFVYNIVLYSLTGLAFSLFCCYPFWFSSLSASMKHFLFIYPPCIWSWFSSPMSLFIVANVIIVFLVGESNLFVGSNSSSASAGDQYYNGYVEMSRRGGVSSISSLQEEKEETMNLIEESDHMRKVDDEVDTKVMEEEKKNVEVRKDDHEEKDISDGEEEPGLLSAEELNKRVEDFIARVNKQRWLEARSLLRFHA